MAFDSLKILASKVAFDAMNNKSDFLKKSGIAGIITTGVCQTAAVAVNKDVPTKEKKFMLPQEIADGAINLTIFWTLTALCIAGGRKMAKGWTKENPSNIFGKTLKSLQESSSLKDIKAFKDYDIEKIKDGYVNGLGTIIGMAGSIVANNFISPPIRNYAASLYQKDKIVLANKQPVLEKSSIFNVSNQTPILKQEQTLTQHNNMSTFLNKSNFTGYNTLSPF